MSALGQQIFYRKYGVRLLQHLMTPMLFDLKLLDLPLKSIYHYVTYDGIELGPPADDYLFRTTKKPIYVGNISQIGDSKGNPRKVAVNENALLRDYRLENKRVRPLRSLDVVARDPYTIVTYNYCFIGKTYRYIRSFYTEYFKWYNTFAAVTKNIAEVTKEIDHQHYLLCAVPKILPSVAQFTVASKNLTQPLLKVFKEPNSYLALELWKWLGKDRSESLFSKIPNNKIHLVNLVFQEAGKWTVLNLGNLNSFRKDPSFDDENISPEQRFVLRAPVQLDAEQIQKRFLRFMMSILASKVELVKAENAAEETPEPTQVIRNDPITTTSDEDDLLEQTDDEDEELPNVDEGSDLNNPSALVAQDVQPEASQLEADSQLEETEEETLARIKQEDELLDQELAQLSEIASKKEQEEIANYTTVSEILEESDISLEDGVMRVCDRLADDGLLTAGEYKRFNNLSKTYKQMKSPYAKDQTVETFMQIKPEELLIENKARFKDSNTIPDKTMLNTSLTEFDSKYIKEFLPKHNVSMVMGVQKAGVAITEHEVEEQADILGAYETHTIKLVPVEGVPSTIKFKIPKIQEDGTFSSNNTKYKIRKQRGDVPLRKVDYNRVALTSYYGKAFINRGRKKIFDYGFWLQSRIMQKALDKEDNDITNILPANVFDPKLKAPRTYTAISMAFKGLVARGYTLYFDQNEVKKLVPEPVLKSLTSEGNLVIGSNGRSYLVLDEMGSVYVTNGDQLQLFGTLEQFLNINTEDAPVEFAELVVFGREIPMGVVLAYHIGFSNLLKLLKVEPRRVEAGTRVTLGLNEYALVFSDETLIFSKDDRLASMIIAGFNDYHRTIKLFSVYSFDKRGVYLNLLDANRLSVRYLRELDLMFQMFIDPITKQLLEEMKEPQTFQGLLFRACEMLLNDEHPDELDPRFMRIKGYERVSGAIYNELVQAIRVHNAQAGKNSKKIELNPYAVWKRITEDPAKVQISEINPIQALKEQEAVTYSGVGGRNRRSMTKNTRAFHPNDMGTISESTVDSSDVAINVFTSANPRFKSVLGLSEGFDFNKDGPTSLLSTSALLAPCSYLDDPKRVFSSAF